MTQFEFYKSFQFVTELIIAEVLYVNRFRRRPLFILRLIAGIGICYLFAFLFPVLSNDPFYCSFTFLMIFLCTVLVCKGIFREKWLTIVFCCIAGYTTQHIAYEFYNMLLAVMGAPQSAGLYGTAQFAGMFENVFVAVVYFSVYIAAYFLCYLFFGSRLKKGEDIHLAATFIFVFSVLILVVDIVLNAIIIYNPVEDSKLYAVIICTYNELCCLFSLYLQFEVAIRKKIETTLNTVERMWHMAKEQYRISKENIELINMKCHDFKHQVRMLQGNTVDEAVIRDLESRISIYESVAATGNDALDVILTEKSLICNNNGIKFTLIADGAQLDFMAKEDIYALFGNIFDNAIEAVLKLDPPRRTISLHIKRIDGILMIRESNYYNEDIRFENGMPVTTKSDKKYHGFGLKSIQYICEQYGGDLSFKAENNIFTLSILFFRDGNSPQTPPKEL